MRRRVAWAVLIVSAALALAGAVVFAEDSGQLVVGSTTVIPSRHHRARTGPGVVTRDVDGELFISCEPAAESHYCARDGETLEERIQRLETALRLAKAERAVNRKRPK